MKSNLNKITFKILIIQVALVLSFLVGCKEKGKQHASVPVENTWYRNSLIYNLDVDAFKDSNGDGIGDFKGLTQKLGYLDSLGVNVIWLAPFQPTSDQDDGYDITDYFGIDPRLGTVQDFNSFMVAAKKRGIKVIMDIVLNHTSIDHSWFKSARADTTSKYYKWYVWSKAKPKDWDKGMVFPGVQNETWTYDEVTKKYYFHRFYDFQPDLNYENPEVQQMGISVLTYWLKQGLDGFRLDAVPFIIDIPRTGSANPEHMFQILSNLRKEVSKVNPEAVLLGEANVTAKENKDYFGAKGERLQMMFNFYANQFLFYSLAKNDPSTFEKALEEFREKPASAQWAFFLRNHDEIDLARLSGSQRKLVFQKFGPESNMQLYDRGIRRRLSPMLSDPRLVRMSYSLLFSLPGAPVIRYGEEIGMGDDLTLKERLSVRTPMQWNNTPMAGFSKGKRTFRPVISLGQFGYKTINVDAETRDTSSLLNFIKKLAAIRKQHSEIGLANWEILKTDNTSILAMRYSNNGQTLITVHNFSNNSQDFNLGKEVSMNFRLNGLLGEQGKNNSNKISLPAYGYQWYLLEKI